VEALLKRLEKSFSSADELRDYLVSEGIKGVRYKSLDCPIARLVNRGRRGPYVYKVAPRWIVVHTKKDPNGSVVKDIRLPHVVTEFIVNFDSMGRYPELREEGSEN
jgi:hypothetical protein